MPPLLYGPCLLPQGPFLCPFVVFVSIFVEIGGDIVNKRQENFCKEFARCGNATEAYRAAGYKANSAHSYEVMASRLLRNVEVRQRIAELSKAIHNEKIMDIAERRERLAEIARDSESTKQDVIKAIDTLNKMDGAYLNRTEITGGVPVVICDDITDSKKQTTAG